MNSNVTFVLGGACSGKSDYAEQLALESPRSKLYIATAEVGDVEMQARIRRHQERRGTEWKLLELPVIIMQPLLEQQHSNSYILIDCLTLWLANLMHYKVDIVQHTDMLLEALQKTKAHVVLVSNEVGLGIVPDNAMAREFRDQAGKLHQRVAKIANRVVFVTAGIPNVIKGA